MILSKQKLQQEATHMGFRAEILEKVFLLMDLLSEFSTYPQLEKKLVLKGGTALNLFHFNLPRLSVDIDLNYIGAIDRETMLEERDILQKNIIAICERRGLSLERNPKVHAGGKMIWRYSSALGQMGNLEIDLNFMYRVPLWPIELKSSCLVGSSQIHQIPVLDIHELAAGKLVALIDRQTGRDLFDAYHLLTSLTLDNKKLRLGLVIYSGMNRKKNLSTLKPQDISFDINEFKNRLIPLLNKNDLDNIKSISAWAEHLVNQCQKAFSRLLPLQENEVEFLNCLQQFREIQPTLISDDEDFCKRVYQHPALLWKIQQESK
jgi:predicted nucleotidyltransferase component of viral defense system